MGWTGIFYTDPAIVKNHKGGVDKKETIKNLLRWKDETHDNEVIDISVKGNTSYIALKIKNKNEDCVVGAVVYTSDRRASFEFCYKLVDESMGPFDYDCPIRIINKLTPTDSEWANEWRRKCIERHGMEA